MASPDALYPIAMAASAVDVSHRAIIDAMKSGDLPYYMHNGRKVVKAQELEDWRRGVVEALPKVPIKDIIGSHTVYRLFDKEGALLYVGVTSNLGFRLAGHRRVQPWWNKVTHVSYTRFKTREIAEAEEGRAIALEDPVHNICMPQFGRRWRTAV